MSTINFKDDFCIWEDINTKFGPFAPWPTSIVGMIDGPQSANIACWYYADCIFSLIPDTTKQQYAATSLVMGLLPLMLKDVAWPHRRIAPVPRLQAWYIEILVRALGLNPIVEQRIPPYGRRFEPLESRALSFLLLFVLLVMYALLAVIELYSKSSSLGCPVPIFIVAWFIIGILPSTVEVGFSRYRRRNTPSSSRGNEGAVRTSVVDSPRSLGLPVSTYEGIQGSGEALVVQVGWALYYTAGTLVFSSIMLVSVAELFVWILATGGTAAASKVFAYKLCGYWGLGFDR